MRLKISLKAEKSLFIPFNYNHIVSSIIYKKIADLKLANELHSSRTFKFFTFSNLSIPRRKIVKNGIISKNGSLNLQISSPNEHLIKNLVEGHLDDLTINFKNEKLLVEKIELLPEQEFNNHMTVKTISPVIVRTKREVNGKLKVWDLTPTDQQFYTNLENNLIKKYNQFYNKKTSNSNDKIHISSNMSHVKRKRITIEKDNIQTYHRAFMMDLDLEGDLNLIKFSYDCGIGEKNSLGFGMIK